MRSVADYNYHQHSCHLQRKSYVIALTKPCNCTLIWAFAVGSKYEQDTGIAEKWMWFEAVIPKDAGMLKT